MKRIKLANGRGEVLVDDADFERLSQHGWCLYESKGKRYAQANIRIGGRWRRVLMHRYLIGAEKGQLVDHEDGDGLNNRRGNLRFATRSQNQFNAGRRRGRFKGVSWHRAAGKWVAQISAGVKRYYLGLFVSEEEAARAYDRKAAELHGEFAKLNFPKVS